MKNVPEGWKLVPVEPTPSMLNEGIAEWEEGTIWLDGGPKVYAAMLAAAPTPPDAEVVPWDGLGVHAVDSASWPVGTKFYFSPQSGEPRMTAKIGKIMSLAERIATEWRTAGVGYIPNSFEFISVMNQLCVELNPNEEDK
ncbi:MAG: hypothetical protein ABI216_21840 [Devosia sp.]